MFEVDDLLPLVDGCTLLGFATVEDADLQINDDGREFVVADILTTKELFARKAADRAPLVRAINNALAASMDGNLPEGSSSTSCAEASPTRRRVTSSTSLLTGDATASSTNTTPTPVSSGATLAHPRSNTIRSKPDSCFPFPTLSACGQHPDPRRDVIREAATLRATRESVKYFNVRVVTGCAGDATIEGEQR